MASTMVGTLYIGMTNNLERRVSEHRQKLIEGFTEKHNVTRLVYYEHFQDVHEAIRREKNLKAWKRQWKIQLIEKSNPKWRDLWEDFGILEKIPAKFQ
jgi:putative endonuclease